MGVRVAGVVMWVWLGSGAVAGCGDPPPLRVSKPREEKVLAPAAPEPEPEPAVDEEGPSEARRAVERALLWKDPERVLRENYETVRALAAECDSEVPRDFVYKEGSSRVVRASGAFEFQGTRGSVRGRLSRHRVRALWCGVVRSGLLAERRWQYPYRGWGCLEFDSFPCGVDVAITAERAEYGFSFWLRDEELAERLDALHATALQVSGVLYTYVVPREMLVRAVRPSTPGAPACLEMLHFLGLAWRARIDPARGQARALDVRVYDGSITARNPTTRSTIEACAREQIEALRFEWMPLLSRYGIEVRRLELSGSGTYPGPDE